MRRLLATTLTALSALGIGGIAHGAGVFAEHAHPPVNPHVPTGGLRDFQPRVPTGGLRDFQARVPTGGLPDSPAPSETIHAVERDASDPAVKTVLCGAYQQLYDPNTNSVGLPSLTSLAEGLLPKTAADRISGVLQTNETRLQSLSDDDLGEVFASLACS
jgi:hypothetical protein